MKKALKEYLYTLRIKNVLILTLTTFFYSIAFYSTVATLFLKSRGLNYLEIFLLESVISASIFIFEIPSGILADKIGRKKLIILSIGCYTISMYITAISHSFMLFVLESAIFGLGVASISGADSALIFESLKKKGKSDYSDSAFSLISGAVTLAMVISLPIGGFLAEHSLNLPVYATCITTTIAFILVFLLKEDENKLKSKKKKNIMKNSFTFVIKKRPELIILQSFNTISFVVILSLYYLNQPLFQIYGIDMKFFGIIMLVVNLLTTGLTLTSPAINRRIGTRGVFLLGNLISGVLLIVIGRVSAMYIGLFALVGCIGISSIRGPIYQSLVNQQIESENRSTIISIISFFGSIVGMLVKPVIGFLSDKDLMTTFVILGIVMIISGIGMFSTVYWITFRNRELQSGIKE